VRLSRRYETVSKGYVRDRVTGKVLLRSKARLEEAIKRWASVPLVNGGCK
jgi:hypothetical protein